MAIIKNGRINLWNAVKKQFEVVHPETETARITDFADGIVQKLALTSAMTAVTALQTDSWFGKLLKMALTASGVKYNIAQNGYVCLGSFFGGLIIQWGSFASVDNGSFVTLPISATPIQVVAVDMASGGSPLCLSTLWYVVGKFKVVGVRIDQSPSPLWGHWIAVSN